MAYLILKALHILGAMVLLGTGLGIAFFLYRANGTRDLKVISFAARQTVLADQIFTLPAVILTPVTGFFLARQAGYSLASGWLMVSLVLFVVAGACWVPAANLQTRMRNLAQSAVQENRELPIDYWHHARRWFLLGVAAFPAAILIFVLMIFKPF